jgi:hypothetical protein
MQSNIGWMPFVVEVMDYRLLGGSVAQEHPKFALPPSEYLARNGYARCGFEQTAPGRLIDIIRVNDIPLRPTFRIQPSLYGYELDERIKGGSPVARNRCEVRSSGRSPDDLQGRRIFCLGRGENAE